MADPKQLCYLCDRLIESIGRATDIADAHGNPIGRPGVCVECDEKHNPELRAIRRQQRNLQAGYEAQPPEETESNPLHTKPGMKKPQNPLGPNLGRYSGPQAPYNPPPPPQLPPDDDEGGNPLNR